ncbi:transcription initiation factor TFIID subunit 11 [Dinochytrium kinnereticum]|nr:transcription initiation factor TFIID subunit 11 [Dinochytrium kinnereticum]
MEIPIDPITQRPVRGRGSRGARGSKPRGEAKTPRGGRGRGLQDPSRASLGPEASRGRGGVGGVDVGKIRGRGRGRGQGRGRGSGSLSILSQSVLVTIPEPFAAPSILPPPTATIEDKDRASSPVEDQTLPVEPLDEDPNARAKDDDRNLDMEEDLYDDLENEIVIHPKSEEEREAMKALIDSFTPERLHRFEVFRRSKLPKGSVKKLLMNILLGSTVPTGIIITVAGSGKMFIGEIVEKAIEVKQEWNDVGALSPEHIREAFRRYKKDQASNPLKR